MSVIERSIRRAIDGGDYFRRPRVGLSDASGHKEWFHFCVSDSNLDLLINFSLIDDTRPAAQEGAETARLTCIVRTDSWDGDIEHFEPADVSARPGQLALRFGDSSMRFEDGVFRICASLRRRPIELDLTFRPVTIPSQVNNIGLGDGPPLHWFLVPRLLASGHVRVGTETVHLDDAPAYHDHNWGYFRWGGDFSWIWGYGHARRLTSPWALAFDRLSNRARTEDFSRGMLLWKGSRQHRLFGERDITLRHEGLLRERRAFKLPRVMALLSEGHATDVPERLLGRAEARGDTVDFEFRCQHLCQIIVPNDGEPGVTIINEVSGDLQVSGLVHREPVEFEGRALFEFLSG